MSTGKILGAWTFIPVSATVGDAFCATDRNMSWWHPYCCRWDIVNKPMDPRSRRGIAVFYYQYQAFCLLGNVSKVEGWADILSHTGMRYGNVAVILEGWAGNEHGLLLWVGGIKIYQMEESHRTIINRL